MFFTENKQNVIIIIIIISFKKTRTFSQIPATFPPESCTTQDLKSEAKVQIVMIYLDRVNLIFNHRLSPNKRRFQVSAAV